MKKIIVALIVVLFVLDATACQKVNVPDTSPEYHFETDCQYYHTSAVGNQYIAETETMLYSISKDGYLYGIEKATMRAVILCSKPECLHDQRDLEYMSECYECNAYVGSQGGRCLNYYNGYLYGIFKDYSNPNEVAPPYVLQRISLDGSSRKNVWILQWKDDIKGNPLMAVMHRGKCYVMLQEYQTGKPTISTVLSYDLKKKKTEIIYQEEGYTSCLVAYGDQLFFRVEGKDLLSETAQYDLTTKELKILEDCFSVIPFGEKLLYYYANTDGVTLFHRLVVKNFDGTEEHPFETVDLNEVPKSGKILHVEGQNLFVMDGISGMEIRRYDLLTGENLGTVPFPEQCKEWAFRFLSYSRDGKLLVYDIYDFNFFYCSIEEIGTPDFQWHQVETIH